MSRKYISIAGSFPARPNVLSQFRLTAKMNSSRRRCSMLFRGTLTKTVHNSVEHCENSSNQARRRLRLPPLVAAFDPLRTLTGRRTAMARRGRWTTSAGLQTAAGGTAAKL